MKASNFEQPAKPVEFGGINDPFVPLKIQEIELGVSAPTHWRMRKEGLIPEQIRIGNRVGLPRSVFDEVKIKLGWPAPQKVKAQGVETEAPEKLAYVCSRCRTEIRELAHKPD